MTENKTENKNEYYYYYKGYRIFVPYYMNNLKCLEKKEKINGIPE